MSTQVTKQRTCLRTSARTNKAEAEESTVAMKRHANQRPFRSLEKTLDELDAKGNVREFLEVARDAISSTRLGEGKRGRLIRASLAQFLLTRKGTITSAQIEEAIAQLKTVAKLEARDGNREGLRIIQFSLGMTYHRQRIRGDKEQNLRRALYYYRRAMHGLGHTKRPRMWAEINVDMADAYFFLTTGDAEANLRKALAHLSSAIEVYTRKEDRRGLKDAAKKKGLVEQMLDVVRARRRLLKNQKRDRS